MRVSKGRKWHGMAWILKGNWLFNYYMHIITMAIMKNEMLISLPERKPISLDQKERDERN